MRAVDLSNYTSPLTPDGLQAIKDAGFDMAIIQAVDPPANSGFPPGVTRQQIQACLDAGLVVDVYIWLWFSLDIGDIARKLMLIDGLDIRMIWLDVEDRDAHWYDQTVCEQRVGTALDVCDAWQIRRGAYVATGIDGSGRRPKNPTGVYSGRWFWVPSAYMNNTEVFADRDLWDANYDLNPDAAAGFVPYGGWTSAAIKQYRGTTALGGISGLDLDMLSVEEEGELQGSEGTDDVLIPDEYVTKFSLADNRDIQGLIDNFEGVISTVREQANATDTDCQQRLQKVKEAVG